jgi:hypothetical protein
MCDPLTIAGIALTAGSTVANTMANNRVAKARSEALNAERLRQAGLDREAEALNAVSQNRYGPEYEKGREAESQQLGDYLAKQDVGADAAAQGIAAADLTPASSSNVTVLEANKQAGKAKAATAQRGQALGELRSFGDYLGGTSRLQARDAGLIGQIGGFKQGSSSIVPYELDAASHKGDSLKTFGDILNFGGSLAIGKGLQGTQAAPGSSIVNPIGGSSAGPWGAALSSTDPWAGLRTITSTRPKTSLLDIYGGVGR